jgi:predicted dehydrogenase
MVVPEVVPFRWGVMGAGEAARNFVVGLRSAANTEVAAVASRSSDRAAAFVQKLHLRCAIDHYAGMVEQPVDAIYLATPPSTHRDLALMCLRADKPVLVEKPFALDAEQAQQIADTARARSVFCMEAMWTRFLPLMRRVRRMVDAGELGTVVTIAGSFGTAGTDPGSLVWNPSLGGGALLDRGVYPLSLVTQLLGRPADVCADAVIGSSGVDEDVACVLKYDTGALAVLHASLRARLSNDLLIVGSAGRVHVRAPIYRPTAGTAHIGATRSSSARSPMVSALKERGWAHALRQRALRVAPERFSGRTTMLWEPYQGNGYHYQATELMRCVVEGRTESAVMPLSESVSVMETADRIRAGWTARPPGPDHRAPAPI